ncbi:MAG: hypothetical protein ACD_4C00479G0001 [uncultured bacterium (gcode 4)]|uniref:Phosphatidic acid phosphatase type 2/haloperoxidase domain-containing protein n=1 Tax=uncultured bacterium (gcode 4) TaxID=1234023 RepID=K2F4F4_9BACT|nr:MAG: hypothetical protein ACD_4C00479G0001 [uncultured bacterium (gcode 4)]
MLEKIISYDHITLNYLRSLVDPTNTLAVELVKIFSDFWVILVAFFLLYLWLYWVFKKTDDSKKASLLIFYSIAFSFLVYILINQWFPLRPRPETISAIKPLVDHLPDNSFPSWHAIFAWAAILAIYFYSKRKYFWIILIFSLIMLVCRIIAGVHYPADILAWLIIWLIWSFAVYKVKDFRFMKEYLLSFPIKIAKYIKL